jgi:prevent-host-death family protein
LKVTVHETVSDADAERNFSSILRGVREGRSYVVTCRGRPVAEIIPAHRLYRVAIAARDALLSRLERQRVINVRRWSRDDLNEDERGGDKGGQ